MSISGISSFAQIENGADIEYRKQFNTYTNRIESDFHHYLNSNDSIFYRFLKDSWEVFTTQSTIQKADQPAPVAPVLEDKPFEIDIIADKIPQTKNYEIEEESPFQPLGIEPRIESVDFYGNTFSFQEFHEEDLFMEVNQKEDVADFYYEMRHSRHINSLVDEIINHISVHDYNDYGAMLFTYRVSNEIFEYRNHMVLFTWYALLQYGIDVKIGFSDRDIFLLVPWKTDLYNTYYFSGPERNHFIFSPDNEYADGSTITLMTYTKQHPGKCRLPELYLKSKPDFEVLDAETDIIYKNKHIKIPLNRNLIKFYQDYPDCDLEIPFSAAMDYDMLRPMGFLVQEGNTQEEKLEKILEFVQYGFEYIRDDEQFGRENALFIEESMFLGNGDCEDRAIIFAHLVRYFLNLEVVGLNYPGHVSTAVRITENSDSDGYLEINGEKYFYCDPTYIGAGIGMQQQKFKNIEPEIIHM